MSTVCLRCGKEIVNSVDGQEFCDKKCKFSYAMKQRVYSIIECKCIDCGKSVFRKNIGHNIVKVRCEKCLKDYTIKKHREYDIKRKEVVKEQLSQQKNDKICENCGKHHNGTYSKVI